MIDLEVFIDFEVDYFYFDAFKDTGYPRIKIAQMLFFRFFVLDDLKEAPKMYKNTANFFVSLRYSEQ